MDTSDVYKCTHPHPKIWLAVSPENKSAISVYEQLGFKKVAYWEEKNKDLMVLE